MSMGTMGARVLLVLLALTAWPGDAQSAALQGGSKAGVAKTEAGDADASLTHDLVLHFDECKVPEGKTFTVEATLQVTPGGLPASVLLSKSSGYPCLDSVAIAAIQAARFSPAKEHGRPVAREVLMPVDFTRVDMTQNESFNAPAGTKAAEVLSKPRLEVGSCKAKSGTKLGGVVSLTVTSEGRPTNVHLVETTGNNCLDGVALKNASGYLFTPAQRNGKSVDFEMQIQMVFEP